MTFVGENTHPFVENQLPRGVRTLGGLTDANTSDNNIALGSGALSATSSSGVVAIGVNAGLTGSNVGNDSVIIGGTETSALPFSNSVAQLGCGADNVIIGPSALGNATVFGVEAIAIGAAAGYNGIGEDTIMIGRASGLGSTANAAQKAVFIGDNAGAGVGTFNNNCIGIGFGAATNGAGSDSIAIGSFSRALTRSGIAIGINAETSSNEFNITIGDSSAARGAEAIAIGLSSEANNVRAVAIGSGTTANGDHSVSLGNIISCSTNNSITLSAEGSAVTSVANGLVISPIAVESTVSLENHLNAPTTATGFTQILFYNPTTKEIRAVTQPTIP